jgi:hypothetical protein
MLRISRMEEFKELLEEHYQIRKIVFGYTARIDAVRRSIHHSQKLWLI